jgi:hypothetical protein
MNQELTQKHNSSLHRLYKSFSPASRAVIILSIPFTLIDAIHYFTAGAALLISFPFLVVIYLICGGLAARFAYQESKDTTRLPRIGLSAGWKLCLTSTVINVLISIILGLASLGVSTLSGAFAFCLYVPFHALVSILVGWTGGWLYRQYVQRLNS